jgi:hypothetical protein
MKEQTFADRSWWRRLAINPEKPLGDVWRGPTVRAWDKTVGPEERPLVVVRAVEGAGEASWDRKVGWFKRALMWLAYGIGGTGFILVAVAGCVDPRPSNPFYSAIRLLNSAIDHGEHEGEA